MLPTLTPSHNILIGKLGTGWVDSDVDWELPEWQIPEGCNECKGIWLETPKVLQWAQIALDDSVPSNQYSSDIKMCILVVPLILSIIR